MVKKRVDVVVGNARQLLHATSYHAIDWRNEVTKCMSMTWRALFV